METHLLANVQQAVSVWEMSAKVSLIQLTLACEPECAVCRGPFATECEDCANGYYKTNGRTCAAECPSTYIPNDEYNICDIDYSKLNEPVLPVDPKECSTGYYWDFDARECKKCDETCYACEFT